MTNNKKPNEKRPGEKEPGKFNYNPGNMAGKTVEICKDESEQQANADRKRSRHVERDEEQDDTR